SVTGNQQIAAVGTLFVLCFGGLAGGHALVGLLVKTADLSMPSLPFLRRYQPSASFPFLMVFIGLVWRALTAHRKRRVIFAALLVGITLGLLIFSYLYLWTAAVAWLVTVGLVWFLLRRNERRNLLFALTIIASIATLVFIPYLYLISNRPATLDEQQTLTLTHHPDLLRIPEILGVLILIILFVAIRQRRIERSDSRVVFAASLALLPLVVFNQQILTGRAMQPYHYAAFVVNYTVLIAVLITATLWWKQIPRRALLWVAALSFMWGLVEVGLPS